ncbi:hypothetical protein [Acetivibrio mesophilus]|uniref:hypothetical protein n=1 Tax=Acetivibrio mesophilus TaxID=2487273 RepID=UPI0013905EF8|nr:hypothetical protein [Acetivibrio mesophilus]
MLGYRAGINHLQSPSALFSVGDASDACNMPAEAHCQEDRGINAELWYILHFSRCILSR